jgi:hypothetical protein
MNLRNLLRVTGALYIVMGLVWMLVPKAMPASYGVDLDPYGAYFLQQLGATNVAIGVLFLLVSAMAASPAGQAVATFMVVLQVLSLLVTLIAILNNAIPEAANWVTVALNLVFALAFAYFRFARPAANMVPGTQS